MIRNPNDPILQQTKDVFGHILSAMEPFSIESMRRAARRGAPVGQIAARLFGITPAGYRAEHTAEQQRRDEASRKVELTPLQKRLRQ
jgi:hypothetical protein